MRRGTEAAKHFGAYLRRVRQQKGMTLHQIATKLETYPSVPSQIETGARVIKEPNLEKWALAYGIGVKTFRNNWKEAQKLYPSEPINRRRGTAIDQRSLEKMMIALTADERSRVRGYIEAVLDERKDL